MQQLSSKWRYFTYTLHTWPFGRERKEKENTWGQGGPKARIIIIMGARMTACSCMVGEDMTESTFQGGPGK